MKIILFFLFCIACFQASMAAPSYLCNPNNVLGLINRDGDLLPLRTGQPIEENLSGSTVRRRSVFITSLQGGLQPDTQKKAENRPARSNLQQERGDRLCVSSAEESMKASNTPCPHLSKAAPTVQPADAACPQSVASPVALDKPKSVPKISMADTYVRLLDVPRYFSIEPPKLAGNLGIR